MAWRFVNWGYAYESYKKKLKGFFLLLFIKYLPFINSTFWPVPSLFMPLFSEFYPLPSTLLLSINFQPRSLTPRACSKFLHPSLFSFKVLAFFPSLFLGSKMGFSHLLNTEASLTNFRATYGVPKDVEVVYCYEGNITLKRHPQVVFFFSINGYLRRGGQVSRGPLHLGFIGWVLTNFLPIFTE